MSLTLCSPLIFPSSIFDVAPVLKEEYVPMLSINHAEGLNPNPKPRRPSDQNKAATVSPGSATASATQRKFRTSILTISEKSTIYPASLTRLHVEITKWDCNCRPRPFLLPLGIIAKWILFSVILFFHLFSHCLSFWCHQSRMWVASQFPNPCL